MPIELVLIASGGVVLTQDHSPTLKQSQVTKKLVEMLSAQSADKKASYNFEGSQYHCLTENQITYLCATDPQTTLISAYSMLNEAKEEFKTQFGRGGYPNPAELNPGRCAPFGSKLQALAREYTNNPDKGSKMGKLKSDIETVKAQMLTNLDDLVKRGGDIENLCDKTAMLTEDAHVFEGESRRLRMKMFWRNVKLAIAIFLALCLVILVICMIACDPNFKKCKSDSPAPTAAPTIAPTPAP